MGPKEKAHFLAFLNERLRDRKLEPLVKNLFRPSYGGNRNCTLMYTLGGMMLSSDDDMLPYALVEDSPESLGEDEVCHGRLYKTGQNGYTRKSFDIVASFLDVLGKPAAQVPANYERGELLIDTAMDLETNATKGLARENSLMLQHGSVPDNAIVKMAQTFRSGTNDIDALDYVDMFLADEQQTTLDELTRGAPRTRSCPVDAFPTGEPLLAVVPPLDRILPGAPAEQHLLALAHGGEVEQAGPRRPSPRPPSSPEPVEAFLELACEPRRTRASRASPPPLPLPLPAIIFTTPRCSLSSSPSRALIATICSASGRTCSRALLASDGVNVRVDTARGPS